MFNDYDIDYIIKGLQADIGPLIEKFLRDERCEDIVLNDDGRLWVKRLAEDWIHIGEMDEISAYSTCCAIAMLHNKVINDQHPVVETIIPSDGSRIECMLPPITLRPIFAIRKRASRIYTLDDYVRDGIATQEQANILEDAVSRYCTILLSGSTGSGKTTLANAVLHVVPRVTPDDRVVIIEDTYELQCAVNNRQNLLANERYSINDLLRWSMRLRPTRIIVGEVRGPEALAMCKAYNTGHPGGLCTVHANSAEGAVQRLASLIQEAGSGANPFTLIREAIDLVVHIAGPTNKCGRRIEEMHWIRERNENQTAGSQGVAGAGRERQT